VIQGGGPSGATSNQRALAVESLISDYSDTVSIRTRETEGGSENFKRIAACDVGLVQASPTAKESALANTQVECEPQQVAVVSRAHSYLVALQDAGIQTWADLPGKNVWAFAPGSGTNQRFKRYFETLEIRSDVNIVPVGPSDLAGEVERGNIDAYVSFGLNKSFVVPYALEVARRGFDLNLVQMDEQTIQTLGEEFPLLDPSPIDIYGWDEVYDFEQSQVDAFTQASMFISSPQVSEDAIYEILRVLHEHGDELRNSLGSSIVNYTDLESAADPFYPPEVIEVHPGAEQFFEDNGISLDQYFI
jgi:TRAP transporter TAXI family solute receptor